MITHITLKDFKKVSLFESNIGKINVLVGANNAGKSSILQGIHFSIMAEVVRRKLNRKTVPQEQLLYLPTADFTVLRHDSPYTNYSGFTSELELTNANQEEEEKVNIILSKGRNYGNISIETTGNNKFRQQLTSFKELYSAYTPGLAGIPYEEKMVSRGILRSAAASGDANLYLRNITYYIKVDEKLEQLNDLLHEVFPQKNIQVSFDEKYDINIEVSIIENEKSIPLELCGTGVLQVIQIMAYTVHFNPKLLLLDEPDEHLHPNNQIILSKTLVLLANKYDMQVILSTHSRHILSALEYEAAFIWIKDGGVVDIDNTNGLYSLLLDLGALDGFDELVSGKYNTVILTEDHDVSYLEVILKANGFDMSKTYIQPYESSSKIDSAVLLAQFIKRTASNCRIIIHRDKDFMIPAEMNYVKQLVNSDGIDCWITKHSDIEAYFINCDHLAHVIGISIDDIKVMINQILSQNNNEICTQYIHKRDEIKQKMYRDNKLKGSSSITCPSASDLFGASIPTDIENVKGKYLLHKINAKIKERIGHDVNIIVESQYLKDNELISFLH